MNMLRVAAVLIAASLSAYARPPEHPDPTLAPWFQSLHTPAAGPDYSQGALCCDVADCRRVESRIEGDHYQAYIDSKTYPDSANPFQGHAPNAWVDVPKGAILVGQSNPTGEAVACWYNGELRCFVPNSGV